jgi:phage-related minor tail protein
MFSYAKYRSYKEGWGKVGKSFKKAVKVVSKGARDAANAAAKAARDAANAAAKAAADALKALREMEEMFKKLMREIGKLPNEISDGFKDLGKLGKDIGDELKKIEKIAKYPVEFGNMIEDQATDVYNKIAGFIESAIGALTNFAEEEIMGILNELANQFKKLGDMIANFFTWIFNKFIEIIEIYIINPVKTFFEDTFVGGIMDVVNFMEAIFNMIKEFFVKIINFLINIPWCVMIWISDGMIRKTKKLLPDWLLEVFYFVNNYIIIPIIGLFSFISKLLGFSIDTSKISKLRKTCYPKLPFIRELTDLIKDLVYQIQNLFT